MRLENVDYISITNSAKYTNKNDPYGVIKNWMFNKNFFVFYLLWEGLNNINFDSVKSHRIKNEFPKKSFTMSSSQWCTIVNAKDLTSSKGKYSIGIFAHFDIALGFASWIVNLFNNLFFYIILFV